MLHCHLMCACVYITYILKILIILNFNLNFNYIRCNSNYLLLSDIFLLTYWNACFAIRVLASLRGLLECFSSMPSYSCRASSWAPRCAGASQADAVVGVAPPQAALAPLALSGNTPNTAASPSAPHRKDASPSSSHPSKTDTRDANSTESP